MARAGRSPVGMKQLRLWRSLGRLARQGRKGTVARLYASLGTLDLHDAALEVFDRGHGTRAHHPVHDERWLGGTDIVVEECLHHPDIVRPIQAATTNRRENRTHLQSPRYSRRALSLAYDGYWCYNACTNVYCSCVRL